MKCLKCGHFPCTGCETWCDDMTDDELCCDGTCTFTEESSKNNQIVFEWVNQWMEECGGVETDENGFVTIYSAKDADRWLNEEHERKISASSLALLREGIRRAGAGRGRVLTFEELSETDDED